MQVERFKSICEKAGLNPCERVTVDGIDIYIADGYVNSSVMDEIYEPSWKTVWLVGVSGKGDIGRSMYFPFGKVTKEERIKAAVADAMGFAKEAKDNGRYN